MRKLILVAVPILAILVGTMTISSARASLIGDFGIGYNDGKSDVYYGNGDGTCPGGSNSSCAGYHSGYVAEELTLQQAQP